MEAWATIERDVMERKELAKSGKYYTYGHYLNGYLIYIGEGKGYRAWQFCDKSYRDQRDHVQVRIFGIFDNKELAVFNEGLLIHQERMDGNAHLLNKSDYGCGTRGRKVSDEQRKKLSDLKIGEKCYNFKGFTIGRNNNNQTIVFNGKKDMKARGFNHGAISQVINGKASHHKNFTFTRSTDPIQLQQLLNEDNFFDEVSKSRIQEFLTK